MKSFRGWKIYRGGIKNLLGGVKNEGMSTKKKVFIKNFGK